MGKLSVYNASAGSGKTYTLVKEYLKIVLSSPRSDMFRNILAVTFTNKAAWEMKTRIINTLEDFSSADTKQLSGMMAQLASEIDLPAGELKNRAANVLKSIFEDYSAFSVGTIDSFTTKLVRSFSRELKLPVGFRIAVDSDNILSESVDMLLLKAGRDSVLSEMLLDFVMRNVDEGRNWDIDSILISSGRIAEKESNIEQMEMLCGMKIEDYMSLGKKLNAYKLSVEKQISDLGDKACSIIYDVLGGDKILAYGASGVASFFRKASQGLVTELNTQSDRVQKFLAGSYVSSSATMEQKILVGNYYDELCRIIDDIEVVLDRERTTYSYAEMLLGPLRRMSVAGEMESQIREVKNRSSVMLLREFNEIISRHLRLEPVPFIYEKIGERYKHYFIDEFQDTSALQWENLKNLVYNQLAGDGSALIVGDAKQAIYRWRGGDSDQFIDLCRDGGGLSSQQVEIKNLDINYRSSPVLVDFANEMFTVCAELLTDDKYTRSYEEGNMQKAAKNIPGFVSIRNIEGQNAVQRQEPMLQAVYDEILRVMSDGFSYSDISVLYRSNRDGAMLAEYLSSKNIPVTSSESLLLAGASGVRFIVSLLRCMAFPDDLQARPGVLNYIEPSFPHGTDIVRFKAEKIAANHRDFLDSVKTVVPAFDPYELQSLPLYEAIEYIASAFGAWGRGEDAYIAGLLDLAAVYVDSGPVSLRGFLEYWDDEKNSASISSPSGTDAVKLMTIHKSKGLEFPVVIFPFASWKIKDSEDIWAQLPQDELFGGLPAAYVPLSGVKKYGLDDIYAPYASKIMLDNLNLLYVAVTRAENQLHVIASLNGRKDSTGQCFEMFLGNTDTENDCDPDGIYLYSKGERTAPDSLCAKDVPAGAFVLDNPSGRPWKDRMRVSLEWKKIWSENASRAVETGNAVHQVLSWVDTAGDIDRAVSKGMSSGILQDNAPVKSLVEAIVADSHLSDYYSGGWEILSEREMMLPGGQVLRPDRVCIKDGHAVVIDYKTGAPKNTHRTQVLRYAEGLETMGYQVDKCILAYITPEGPQVTYV